MIWTYHCFVFIVAVGREWQFVDYGRNGSLTAHGDNTIFSFWRGRE